MKSRRVALLAAVAGVAAGLVWWRRRSSASSLQSVQLGLADGSVHVLDETDPSRAELVALAAAVRDSLTGGT